METIARRLNLSKVTVSNAMRGSGRLSEATRKRVMETAKQMGYRPNPLVTALMSNLRRRRSGRRCTLAFLNFFPGKDDWKDHPTFVQFHRGATQRSEELGYRLEPHWQGEVGGNNKRLGNILYARGIPGLIIAPLPAGAARIDLEWGRFATVAIGQTFRQFSAHRVSNHQVHTVRLAVQTLMERGVRRIGLTVPKMDDEKVENAWLAGVIAAQFHFGLPAVRPMAMAEFTPQAVVAWVKKERVEAVLSTNNSPMIWLRRAGVRVPEDVGFVHLDWSPEKGDLAGVDQRSDLIGAAAVDLLIEQLNNNETGVPARAKTVLIDGDWHEGPTLRPPGNR